MFTVTALVFLDSFEEIALADLIEFVESKHIFVGLRFSIWKDYIVIEAYIDWGFSFFSPWVNFIFAVEFPLVTSKMAAWELCDY